MPPKRRPGGLARAAAAAAAAAATASDSAAATEGVPISSSDTRTSKRLKTEDAGHAGDAPASHHNAVLGEGEDDNGDGSSSTLAVQMSGDAGDELTEVKELFESALEKLGGEDMDEGSSLLRAVVHESDRILRSHYEKSDQTADTDASTDAARATVSETTADSKIPTALDPEFHFVYASALYRLGLVSAEDSEDDASSEQLVEYLDAAIHRYERGLELWKDSAPKGTRDWRFAEALARVLTEKANLMLRLEGPKSTKADNLASQSVAHMQAAFDTLMAGRETMENALEECESIASLLARHAELHDELAPHLRWSEKAQSWFKDILQVDQSNIGALKGLGKSYISTANLHLELAESGEMMDSRTVGELVALALENLEKANQLVEAAGEVDTTVLCLLGEALVNKANLFDEAEDKGEANKLYQRAVDCFKKVEQTDPDELPDQFGTFVRDWDEDLKNGRS
ncbi:hypothetical protein DFJ73DRAFT_773795 [Zopfochytrium polystomum]|nr:hypothetical protein DFJ73DRAFT_773795 [Zopfochytrium polystomum]